MVSETQITGVLERRQAYRHGNVPMALRAAVRQALDAGGIEPVGLREVARAVGVSSTAAYRHFSSKDDLLASVAAEGFCELAAALLVAADGGDPTVGVGLAYVEFALTRRGLFRLMFGPLLARRKEFAALNAEAEKAFKVIEGVRLVDAQSQVHKEARSIAAFGLIHGLSELFVNNALPTNAVRSLAHDILFKAAHG